MGKSTHSDRGERATQGTLNAVNRRQLLIAGGGSASGGTLTWGSDTDPTHLIPFGANATATWRVTSLIYESLVAWDRNLKVVPALAESWDAPDSRTFVFKLRRDVRFHSGKPLDAEDVKYSIEPQKSPPPPARRRPRLLPADRVRGGRRQIHDPSADVLAGRRDARLLRVEPQLVDNP